MGQIIQNFSLKNIDGHYVALDDYKNEKGVIIIFTSNSCPFSISYEKRLFTLHNQYGAKGFPVLLINSIDTVLSPIDTYENMQERAGDFSYPFPYLKDEDQNIAKIFGATNTPHAFVMQKSKDGFKVIYIGAIDNNAQEEDYVSAKYIENAIDEFLIGNPVSSPRSKPVGCDIKWR
ncbi:MAG: alkyl hydroperoxide reductase [Bacteroidetes bacterium OLB11]|nr:MAG: alkyl hydroperoxide reductase [Bacteroidetes bacterium OLB11]